MASDNLQKNKPGTESPEQKQEGAPGSQPATEQPTDKTAGAAKTGSDNTLIGELLADGKQVLNLFRQAFSGSAANAKPDATKAQAAQPTEATPAKDREAGQLPDSQEKTFTQLPDGTKIGKDGSIEFSAADSQAIKDKKDVLHTWTDKQGQHRLEIRNGVVYLDDYKVTEDKIIKKDGDHETDIGKRDHTVQVSDHGDHFLQTWSQGGTDRTVRQAGQDYQFTQHGQTWSILSSGGARLAQFTGSDATTGDGAGRVTLLGAGESVSALSPDKQKELGINVDAQGNLGATLSDGTRFTFLSGQGPDMQGYLLSLKKGDIELQMSLDGKTARVRRGDGEWQDVPADALPKEFKDRIAGHVIQLDGNHSFDIVRRQIITNDPKLGTHVDWDGNKPSLLNVRGGPQIILRDGHFEILDPNHPDQKPVIWEPDKHRLTTAMGVFSDAKTVLNNGDEVYLDGRVRFRNQDGTFDTVDRNGNLQTAGGTRIGADMKVHTSDGKTYNARGGSQDGDASVIGSAANAASVADQGNAVAASVEGKPMVDFDDVARLADSQGNISMLIATCMASGDLGSVSTLMAAQSRVDGALSYALGRAQACAIAHQMGVFSPSLIEEMQHNIYGKTPLQAVQGNLESRN